VGVNWRLHGCAVAVELAAPAERRSDPRLLLLAAAGAQPPPEAIAPLPDRNSACGF